MDIAQKVIPLLWHLIILSLALSLSLFSLYDLHWLLIYVPFIPLIISTWLFFIPPQLHPRVLLLFLLLVWRVVSRKLVRKETIIILDSQFPVTVSAISDSSGRRCMRWLCLMVSHIHTYTYICSVYLYDSLYTCEYICV